ncbi:MAG: hypothetical protein IAG13_34395 [Deltaproteobacteria bacterium]|nr:hypothetical protein [Nannocystaceae bacterium]
MSPLVLLMSLALAPSKLLDDARAQALFDEAQQAFADKDYAAASEKLEQAYLLEPAPELLYPWAQAERNLDRCASAIDLYEKYIETQPSARMVEAAQQNIDRCKETLAAAEPEPPAPEPVVGTDEETAPREAAPKPKPSDGEPRKIGRDPAGAVLVSLGGAGLVAGGVLLGVAVNQAKKTENPRDNANYLDMREAALKQRNAGIAVMAIGGALAIAGVIRYGVLAKKRKRTEVGVWVDRSGGAVSIATRF